MRRGVPAVVLAGALSAVLALAGCSDDPARPLPAETGGESAAPPPAYDATREPAAAVLSLVPEAARRLTVTDFDEVREELGLGDLTTPEELADFWARADAERPLLTRGMLRGRPGAGDVAWEAHFFDAADTELGWVLGFHEGATPPQVPGGTVDAANNLVTSGTTSDPEQSWAASPELTELVGLPANATYVERGCLPGQGGTDLDPLERFSVGFEGGLVTARFGAGRHDLFVRMRAAAGDPTFAAAYSGGVADPQTGRIGYVMTDPAGAARRALRRRLPFAACA